MGRMGAGTGWGLHFQRTRKSGRGFPTALSEKIAMTLTVIEGTGLDVEEPNWDVLIPNAGRSKAGNNSGWREVARAEWRRVTAAMRAAGAEPMLYAELPHAHHMFDAVTGVRSDCVASAVAAFLGIVYARHMAAQGS